MASLLEKLKIQELNPKKCDSENFISGHTAQWLPRGSKIWRCEICEPPKQKIFIAERRDLSQPQPQSQPNTSSTANPITLADRIAQHDTMQAVAEHQSPTIIAYEHAACPRCQSTWIVDLCTPDNALRCWSCRAPLATPELIRPLPKQHARRLLAWSKQPDNQPDNQPS